LKVAVTETLELRVTVQVPVPEHPPLQPENTEPLAAAAVRVTLVPLEKLAAHVPLQLIPAGLLLTVPPPVPDLVTPSVKLVDVGTVAHDSLENGEVPAALNESTL